MADTTETIHTKPTMIIRAYFGPRAEEHRIKKEDGTPQSPLVDFAGEMKALTGQEKYELAVGAAKNMGYTAAQIEAIEKA
jgi:hypothetical protein